jgi:hypothetical protein
LGGWPTVAVLAGVLVVNTNGATGQIDLANRGSREGGDPSLARLVDRDGHKISGRAPCPNVAVLRISSSVFEDRTELRPRSRPWSHLRWWCKLFDNHINPVPELLVVPAQNFRLGKRTTQRTSE